MPENSIIPELKKNAVKNNDQHGFVFRKNKQGEIERIPTKFAKSTDIRPDDLGKVILPGKKNDKLRKAFELCVKYDGDLSRAVREAGYSENLIKSPMKITKTMGWKKLIEYCFPTFFLFEKDMELLNNFDWRARANALDRIHKLKGNFTRQIEIKLNPTGDMANKSNEELQRIIEGEFEIGDDEEGSPVGMEDEGEDRTGQEGNVASAPDGVR